MVEEGQDVGAAAPQCVPELGDLLQSGRHAAADRLDHCGQGAFAAGPIRVGVGGDDLLIDQPGDLDGEVLVAVKHDGEPVVLAGGQQTQSGSGDAPDPVERVAGVSTPVKGLLLDAL